MGIFGAPVAPRWPQGTPKAAKSSILGIHVDSRLAALGCCFEVCILMIFRDVTFAIFDYDLETKLSQKASQMETQMEPKGDLRQKWKNLVLACIYSIFQGLTIPKSRYFGIDFPLYFRRCPTYPSGRHFLEICVILVCPLGSSWTPFGALEEGRKSVDFQ